MEEQIKNLDRQIRQAKEMSDKLRTIEIAMQRLLPAILEAVGSDHGSTNCPPTSSNVTRRSTKLQQLVSQLERELSATGVSLDPDALKRLTEAMRTGGAVNPELNVAAIPARIRAILNQVPVLFQISALRP